jgi:putative nucleotidyltransferase with HDIG domain
MMDGPALLAVDDDPGVLTALSRLLRPDGVRVLTATGGQEALAVMEADAASVGAVVSDYAMPGMNGAEFLAVVRSRWPDVTRLMLTGNADLPAAARAVNEGQLSRLYTKPWQPDEFRVAIAQALGEYRLVIENRRLQALADEQAVRLEHQAARLEQWNDRLEQLVAERTAELGEANASLHRGLLDSVRLLITFLERRLPNRANRCREVARLAGRLAERAGMSDEQMRQVQVAALVHDIGLISLPDAIVQRDPTRLPPTERGQYERHAVIGASMLGSIERLAEVATWIRHHHERWDGQGYPDRLAGEAIPLVSRIIALADGYLDAASREGGTAQYWRHEQHVTGAYDPTVLVWLDDELAGRVSDPVKPVELTPLRVPIDQLTAGMMPLEPIRSDAGTILLQGGAELTAKQVDRVRRLSEIGTVSGDVLLAPRPAQHNAKARKEL